MPSIDMPDILESPYESLKGEVDGYIKYSRFWAAVWAVVYYLLRGILIVISACVAAKGDLRLTEHLVAILSVSLAVGTALDTWLKTGNRYKGHYTFNDKFIALYTDLELTQPADAPAIGKIKEDFKKLLNDYAVAVLPT